MPKRPRDPIEKARRKLAEAQVELHIAQERRLAAIAQGERETREVEERAARRTQKATERLEKRAGAVARAEAQLYTLSARIGRLRAERTARKTAKNVPAPDDLDVGGAGDAAPLEGQ
jgi:hypothetical protein